MRVVCRLAARPEHHVNPNKIKKFCDNKEMEMGSDSDCLIIRKR